jgi:hypothetical protein
MLCSNGHALPGGKVTPKFCPICGVSVFQNCVNGHALAPGVPICPLCAATSADKPTVQPAAIGDLPGLSTAPTSLVIGLPPSSSQQTPSSRNPAWIWGLIVVAMILVAGGIFVGLHIGHSAPQPGTTSATVITSRHPQTSGDNPGTRRDSGGTGTDGASGTTGDTGNSGSTTTVTTLPGGLTAVDTSAVASQSSADAIALTFETYFGGIDSQNWDLAYSAYSPQYQSNNSESSFESTHTTTSDTEAAITSIGPGPLGSTQVDVSFQSMQAPADGPVEGETCTNWTLTYTLVPGISGSLSYLINSATPVGPGHTGCPGQP